MKDKSWKHQSSVPTTDLLHLFLSSLCICFHVRDVKKDQGNKIIFWMYKRNSENLSFFKYSTNCFRLQRYQFGIYLLFWLKDKGETCIHGSISMKLVYNSYKNQNVQKVEHPLYKQTPYVAIPLYLFPQPLNFDIFLTISPPMKYGIDVNIS